VDSGTLALTSMTAPGIVGADMAHVAHGLPPNDLDSWRQHPFDAARFIFKALQASRPMVGPIIVQETGVTLGHLIEGLIPSLLMAVGVLGATTVLGTVVGGAVGAFAGGFGAAPGAALGGQLGFDIGMAALAWMGLAFIVVSLGQGLPQLNQQAALGIKRAVHAMNLPPPARPAEMLEASRHFAQAQALLFKLILMGLVAWLLKKGAESSALKAEASVRAIPGASRAGTSVEAAEASVADMLAQIRKSRLGNSFADFIELEWRKLIENPKLRPQTAVKAVTKAEAEVVTPSQLAKMRHGHDNKTRTDFDQEPQTASTIKRSAKDDLIKQSRDRSLQLKEEHGSLTSPERLARIDKLSKENYNRLLENEIGKQEYVYRYRSEKGLSDSMKYGSLRGYTTTEFSTSSAEVANGAQILPEWGTPKYGVKIPTKDLAGFEVARPMGDTAKTGWEAFTNSYPEAGSGGWTQFKINEIPFNPDNLFKLNP